MSGQIRVEREDNLGWVIFDHPERRNAISGEMWVQLPEALASLDADPEVRVILLRGAGDVAFISGADISEFEKLEGCVTCLSVRIRHPAIGEDLLPE